MPRFDSIRERTFFRIEFDIDGRMSKLTKAQRGPNLIEGTGRKTFDHPLEIVIFASDDDKKPWRQADTHATFNEGSSNAQHLVGKMYAYRDHHLVGDLRLDGAGWVEGVFMRDLA